MIWKQWLIPVRPQVEYSKFQHVEYEEQVEQRPQVKNTLTQLVHSFHTRSRANTNLLTMLGYPLTGLALKGDQRPLTNEIRRGHLAEILACEFARERLGYDVPVHRLRYNPNPDQSMKGDDILGFRFASDHEVGYGVLIGEAKYRSTYVSEVVIEAYEALQRGFRPYPISIDFVATILDLEGDRARASQVRQIKHLLAGVANNVISTNLLFLVTMGRPRDPFGRIEALSAVSSNLVAVNISLGPGVDRWIDQIYEQEPIP